MSDVRRALRVSFLVNRVQPQGGLTLATFRLAQALTEAGADVEVVHGAGEAPRSPDIGSRRCPPLQTEATAGSARSLRHAMAARQPDLIISAIPDARLLAVAADVAPTLLHAHNHGIVCPDGAKYWHRAGRACGVRGGWKCAALRPVLGCADMKRTLRLAPVREQQRLGDTLGEHGVGVIAISGDQRRLLIESGISDDKIALIPNLGLRLQPDELAAASRTVSPPDRSAVVFIGRLDKTKGVRLLPRLRSAVGPSSLRVYGDGYLARWLAADVGDCMRGEVAQQQIAGTLLWARGLAFLSLWPEPGGIVGIDAQLFGVPTGAFRLGAALDWPSARLFAPGDVAAMGGWLGAQPERVEPRDPSMIAHRQRAYWSKIGQLAIDHLDHFVRSGVFQPFSPHGTMDAFGLLGFGVRRETDKEAGEA